MEKNNHNNQNTIRPQGSNHNEEKKTDGQTKKPEIKEATNKPTTSHAK